MKILPAMLVATAIGALELPAAAPLEPAAELVLGVLRRDGIVAPFATFDGRRWSSRWPNDISNRELPISLQDVPESWWGVDAPPRTMTIWRDGVRAGSVALTDVTTTRLMCERRIALKTDYKPSAPPPPPFEMPYPKDGLVIAGDAALEPIESPQRGSAEWNQALILITEQFNREENRAATVFTSWRHPMRPEQRRMVPITMEAVYRAPTDDPKWTAYYVEAVRQYPPGREDKDGCGLATFGQGWVLVGPKNESKVRLSAKVTYCDRKGVSYMLPFGLIRANGKGYWVFQFSGFEEEWYEVAEPTHRGTDSHVAYRAGYCPR
ncbi:MAG TPA: hypothetical protein VJ813_14560 [Vicinamibacterales bacterium]|nr:hypothetical protein [Vicinamibacterales bacterium]